MPSVLSGCRLQYRSCCFYKPFDWYLLHNAILRMPMFEILYFASERVMICFSLHCRFQLQSCYQYLIRLYTKSIVRPFILIHFNSELQRSSNSIVGLNSNFPFVISISNFLSKSCDLILISKGCRSHDEQYYCVPILYICLFVVLLPFFFLYYHQIKKGGGLGNIPLLYPGVVLLTPVIPKHANLCILLSSVIAVCCCIWP